MIILNGTILLCYTITVSSLQNHTVERMWVEINGRVNYPIKSALIGMQQHGEIDLDSPAHQICTSWFTLRVASASCTLAVQAWNNHPVPGTS